MLFSMIFRLVPAMIAVTAAAQTNLTLRDAVTTAMRDHPLLAAGRDRISVAEGLRRQAGFMPNPRLILQSENTRTYGNPSFVYWRDADNFAYLQQTFETAGKRDRRVDLASANVRRAELERELLERQIAGRVKQAYWYAVGARRAEQVLTEDLKNFQRIIEYHEIRVKEGAMAEADLIRVRLERERLLISLSSATLEAERARIHLYREMGQTQFPEVQFTEALEPVADPSGNPADVSQALEKRPEVRLARQLVEVARSSSGLQQAVSKPNVDVLFGYKRTTGFNTMLGGVQVDLPFHNRNQGNIAAAAADLKASESSLAATEALVKAEIQAAQRDYELRKRQVTESFITMRAQADEAARIADAAYREGGTDLLRLLDAQRVRIETQLLYFRALSEYHQSVVALDAALGVAP
jgi:cobalt-zinc-cadmium efflux system outer membrane protein